ncbi:MAG TPA: undecaprenyldiphospho-muramoylpentapeptide beta-N-acetylglucosaminyltransferase [Cytophagales bacterium]|jgi:UDP-N-acetylglucosamine--N-acetylmuramyl-(pentapeptide) pyrophosphoryl-undecaprenol N-acetylglucosamine transferase|nr:undecaprenyldiphospho-muramoylpentapeptide beta-N-acetylglucosaminyltransferase [Cytophagales bacterium]
MNERTEPYRIILSGGGTGGHIYPAIAVANELRAQFPNVELLFVGALGKMEMQKVPDAGYKIEGLPISGIQRSLSLRNLSFPFKLMNSMIKARRIINSFKPHVVVGFGGYASGPVLRAAGTRGIPSLLQEQNSYAGLTNKLLGKRAEKVCVAYEGMDKYFDAEKIALTGNPVRSDIQDVEMLRNEALKYFDLRNDKAVLLVMGGSLGARSINNAMLSNIGKLDEAGIQVIWQTGKFYFEEMKNKVAEMDLKQLKLTEFLTEMKLAYAAADVVMARAGALTISELCLAKKATVLVPSPNVAEDHQTKNAKALADRNAAILLPDAQAENELANTAIELINNQDRLEDLKKNIRQMARPNAAKDIVKEIMNVIS